LQASLPAGGEGLNVPNNLQTATQQATYQHADVLPSSKQASSSSTTHRLLQELQSMTSAACQALGAICTACPQASGVLGSNPVAARCVSEHLAASAHAALQCPEAAGAAPGAQCAGWSISKQVMGRVAAQATALALSSRMQQSMVAAGVCHELVLHGVAHGLTTGG
jgi:hypothetical protein